MLSLVGMGICAYMTFLHLGLLRGELLGGAVCGEMGTIFNCHAVTAGRFGTFLHVPLSLWGLVGYLATLSLACIAWQFSDWTSKAFAALAILSAVLLLLDVGLLVVMVTQIRYLCPLCLVTYGLNLAIFLCAAAASGRSWGALIAESPTVLRSFLPVPRVAVVWFFWGVVGTGLLGVLAVQAATTFVVQGSPKMLRHQMAQYLKQQTRVQVETRGDPMLGAPTAAIQLVEFSDFLCPSCQRASRFNPILLAGHRKNASFTFKHFPLDTTCNTAIKRLVHPHACQIAAATECAHEQGKFWAFHDLVFQQGPNYKVANLEQDASRAGLRLEAFRDCMQAGRGLEAVQRDISEGARLEVTSTPTYLINGARVTGVLTPAMFEEFLAALQESSR